MRNDVSRRPFLRSTGLASAAAAAFPAILRSQTTGGAPGNRLNVAYIGVGGRGGAAVQGLKDENLVAFCDVDDERPAKTYEEFADVPRERGYRNQYITKGYRAGFGV